MLQFPMPCLALTKNKKLVGEGYYRKLVSIVKLLMDCMNFSAIQAPRKMDEIFVMGICKCLYKNIFM